MIQWFKRNACKECDYYHAENNVCQSKKCEICGCHPYVNWFDRHFCQPYKALEQESMRDATSEELKSVNDYIKSISKPTGVKFDFDEEQEQIDFVQPHRTVGKLISEVEVVTRGNCMICGKELTEGLFLCKECEDKASSRK